jgi:GAF domain-containing protein
MSPRKGQAESQTPQQRIEHLYAVLRAIRNVNQLIIREKDPDALVRQACSLLVETRGYYSAWIALLDDEGTVRTVAESGLGEAFQPVAERLQRG